MQENVGPRDGCALILYDRTSRTLWGVKKVEPFAGDPGKVQCKALLQDTPELFPLSIDSADAKQALGTTWRDIVGSRETRVLHNQAAWRLLHLWTGLYGDSKLTAARGN